MNSCIRYIRIMSLISSALAMGCFEYRQVPLTAVPIGKDVRVTLSDDGYARLVESVGSDMPRIRRTLEGPLISVEAQQLLVGVSSWVGRPGTREDLQQRVAVPVADVLGIERKLLNRRKTTIVAGGAAAALVVFITYYVSGQFGGTTSPFPEPGQGESVQVPIRLRE